MLTCRFTKKTEIGIIKPCTCTKHAIISLHLIKMVVVVVFILVTSGDDDGCGGGNGGCAF
jgi:hypothetical protein